jgi:hypothetical protein
MPSLTNYRERHYLRTIYLNCSYLLYLSLEASTVATGPAQTLAVREAQQAAGHEPGQAPFCDPDLIDGTFTFANLPVGEQTVSLHFLNKSDAACRLHGESGPTFAVDSHSMNVGMCWLCDRTNSVSYAPERQAANQILLAPRGRALLDLHWASSGESCQWADWVTFNFWWATQTGYLFIPAEWPMHICSIVNSIGYRAETNSPFAAEGKGGVLRVSLMETAIYSDERAMLHAELTGATTSVAGPVGCASLYSVRQGPSSLTRLDPLPTMGSFKRPSYTPEQAKEDLERVWPSSKKDLLRRCDIPGGTNSRACRRIATSKKFATVLLAPLTKVLPFRVALPPVSKSLSVRAEPIFKGAVSDEDGLPAADVQVVLVPEVSRRSLHRFYKSVTTDQYGHFEIRGIAAGDYRLFSWERSGSGRLGRSRVPQAVREKGRERLRAG